MQWKIIIIVVVVIVVYRPRKLFLYSVSWIKHRGIIVEWKGGRIRDSRIQRGRDKTWDGVEFFFKKKKTFLTWIVYYLRKKISWLNVISRMDEKNNSINLFISIKIEVDVWFKFIYFDITIEIEEKMEGGRGGEEIFRCIRPKRFTFATFKLSLIDISRDKRFILSQRDSYFFEIISLDLC